MKKPPLTHAQMQQIYVLQRILMAAIADSKLLPRGNQEFEKTKASARSTLSLAWVELEGRRGGKLRDDLPTTSLFNSRSPALDLEAGVKLRVLLHDEFPEMEKLSGLRQLSLIDVERIFELHDILCPLALKLFCSAAEKHRAELESSLEKTQPTPLTCTA